MLLHLGMQVNTYNIIRHEKKQLYHISFKLIVMLMKHTQTLQEPLHLHIHSTLLTKVTSIWLHVVVHFRWDSYNFLVQCAHIHVDPKRLALMFHFVEIIVISFCKLVHIHMFPKSLAFQENCTTLLVCSQTIETSYKSSSSSSSHTSKFGFHVNESPLFTNEEDHLILYPNLNDVFIKMCLMPLSLRKEFRQAWNEWCMCGSFCQSFWKRICQSHQLLLSPSCFQVFANDYLLFKDLHKDPNFNILCTKVFGLQRVWICVASSHHFLAFFCLLHFLMLNHKTEKKKIKKISTQHSVLKLTKSHKQNRKKHSTQAENNTI